jgi:hypothetical protein
LQGQAGARQPLAYDDMVNQVFDIAICKNYGDARCWLQGQHPRDRGVNKLTGKTFSNPLPFIYFAIQSTFK